MEEKQRVQSDGGGLGEQNVLKSIIFGKKSRRHRDRSLQLEHQLSYLREWRCRAANRKPPWPPRGSPLKRTSRWRLPTAARDREPAARAERERERIWSESNKTRGVSHRAEYKLNTRKSGQLTESTTTTTSEVAERSWRSRGAGILCASEEDATEEKSVSTGGKRSNFSNFSWFWIRDLQ